MNWRLFGAWLGLWLSSSAALAQDVVSFRTGFGPTTARKSALYSMAWEEKAFDDIFYKIDAGFWTDAESGHSSAPFVGPLLGYRFGTYRGFNVVPAVGFLVMGYPDALLGSPFNFTEEFTVGYTGLGIGWKHISNAGFSSPNAGRDYIFLNFAIPTSL